MKTAERPHFLNLWQESIKMKKKFLFKVVRINIDRILRLKNQFRFYRDFRHFGNWKIYIAATYTWIRIRIREYVFKKTCLRWFVCKIYVLAWKEAPSTDFMETFRLIPCTNFLFFRHYGFWPKYRKLGLSPDLVFHKMHLAKYEANFMLLAQSAQYFHQMTRLNF